MRSVTWGVLLLACACSDNDGDERDAAPPDAPLVIVDAPRVIDATRPFDGAAVDGRTFDGAIAIDARTFDAPVVNAPQIQAVVITHAQPCTASVSSATTVEIVATDVETAADDLTYAATGDCGTINMRVNQLTCPQVSPYPYTLTVRDADNHTATRNFTISPCTNTPDAGQ